MSTKQLETKERDSIATESHYEKSKFHLDLDPTKNFQMIEFPPPPESPRRNLKYSHGYQQGRASLVRKNGNYRVGYKGLKNQRKQYLRDLYQTLVDLRWRWALFVIIGIFFIVYMIFAVLWYLLCFVHGDFHNLDNPTWVSCVKNLRSFPDAMLFSIETQTTIGYGTMYPVTEACGAGIPLAFLQVTLGFILETILLGFMLVKISRPKHRAHTLLFSKNACITQENGKLCLQVRLGDMRQSHLVDTQTYGIFIKDKISKEGHLYPLYQHRMDFHAQGMDDKVFLIWPLVLNHVIDEESPLWSMGPEEILSNNFEIVVVLEGIIESTGELCQARTSYTSKDIVWGFRFAAIEEFDNEKCQWKADFEQFHDVIPSFTPRCSAKATLGLYDRKGTMKNGIDSRLHLRKTQSHKDTLVLPSKQTILDLKSIPHEKTKL